MNDFVQEILCQYLNRLNQRELPVCHVLACTKMFKSEHMENRNCVNLFCFGQHLFDFKDVNVPGMNQEKTLIGEQ